MKRFLMVGLLASCGVDPATIDDGGGERVDAGWFDAGSPDAGSFSCTPCLETSECGPGAACVQYAGNDFCGHLCYSQAHCGADEVCIPTVAEGGTQLSACVPSNGTCGDTGCGTCDPGDECDLISGTCVTPEVDADAEEDEEWVVELSVPWKLVAPGGRPAQLPVNFSRLETLEGERIREVWSRGCGALSLD